MTFYAIAVDTAELGTFEGGKYAPGRDYRTRYWGANTATYLWHNEATAVAYMEDLDGSFFDGKSGTRHQVDDVYVVEVTDIKSVAPSGDVMFPWFSTPKYTDEGYDTPPIYAEMEQSNA